jgi:hypothetical protein
MTDETENLRELLRVSNVLAHGLTPFVCSNVDCPYCAQPVTKETCLCYNEQYLEHQASVREALK